MITCSEKKVEDIAAVVTCNATFAALTTLCGASFTNVNVWSAATAAGLGMAALGTIPVIILVNRYKLNPRVNCTSFFAPSLAFTATSSATTYGCAAILGYANPAHFVTATAIGAGSMGCWASLLFAGALFMVNKDTSCQPLLVRFEEDIRVVHIPVHNIISAGSDANALNATINSAIEQGAVLEPFNELAVDKRAKESFLKACIPCKSENPIISRQMI